MSLIGTESVTFSTGDTACIVLIIFSFAKIQNNLEKQKYGSFIQNFMVSISSSTASPVVCNNNVTPTTQRLRGRRYSFLVKPESDLVVEAYAEHLVRAAVYVLTGHRGATVTGVASRHVLGVVVVGGPEVTYVEFHVLVEFDHGLL